MKATDNNTNQKTVNLVDISDLPQLLRTAEAAQLLRKSIQTLRVWACRQSGPIQPVRTQPGAPLLWKRSDIEKLMQSVN